MEQRKITLRHEVITPLAAYTTIMQEMYERQRKLDQRYVRQYALEMRKRTFRQGTLISFAIWQGKRYLINGQHTNHAIILADMPYPLGIEEIYVESYEEIADWYDLYDRVNSRTMVDSYRAHNLAQEVQLNETQTTHLGGCLPLLASGFDSPSRARGSMHMYVVNPILRNAFVREWAFEAHRFFEDIKGAPGMTGRNLRRGPVFAVALVTYRYTGQDASEFWHMVAMDDRTSKNDPRKRLHIHIRTSKVGEYGPEFYSRYVANAWNAAWDGRTPTSLHPQIVGKPLELKGTPHNGKDVLRYITPRGEVLHDPVIYQPASWVDDLFPRSPEAA